MTIQDNQARALQESANFISTLFGNNIGLQIKNVLTSPEFSKAISNAGSSIISSPEFKTVASDIGKGLFSDMASNQLMKDFMIGLFRSAIGQLIKSEDVKNVFMSIATTLVDNLGNLIGTQQKEFNAHINQEIQNVLFGEDLKELFKSSIEEMLVPMQELIVQGIQASLSNLKPTIEVKADLNLNG
jgi:hypothetical protein